MNCLKILLLPIFFSFSASKVFAANIYTITCPKCNYEVRVRTGRTKLNSDVYRVYFCKSSKELMSIPDSKLTSYNSCKSGLKLFHPKKEGVKCPVCKGGPLLISKEIIAC